MSIKPIKYTARFNRKNKLNKEGKAAIEIELSKDRRRFISTGIYIEPKHWNEEGGTITNNVEKKQKLQTFLNSLINIENAVTLKQGYCSVGDLITEIGKKTDVPNTFFDFAMDCFKNEVSLSQKRKDDIKRILTEFKDYTKDIKIKDISIKVLNEYKGHLETEGYHVNTIQHRFKIFKKYATR